MRLILIRHGDAEDFAESDFQRNLSAKGLAQASKVGQFLGKIDDLNKANLIFSPYMRAAQTAKIITESCGHDFIYIEDKRLGCGMSPHDAFEVIRELPFDETTIMVGHQPDIGELIAYFLNTGSAAVKVSKASVVLLKVESLCRGGGTLVGLFPVKYI